MATAQGRETGQRRAIGSALGISGERVREIVKREERRDQRTRELQEACFRQQQPNPLQLSPRLRNMLAKLLGPPNFTTDVCRS
jgi:hypothetical protein